MTDKDFIYNFLKRQEPLGNDFEKALDGLKYETDMGEKPMTDIKTKPINGFEIAIQIAKKDQEMYSEIALTHPEDSQERDRCYARARACMHVANKIYEASQ